MIKEHIKCERCGRYIEVEFWIGEEFEATCNCGQYSRIVQFDNMGNIKSIIKM